jgi:hypothetical protein
LEHRRRWNTPRLEAELWWCGDEVCDCTKPQIVRISPGNQYPWVKREAVWEGTFLTHTADYSQAEREQLQFAPLREACREHKVAVPDIAVPV